MGDRNSLKVENSRILMMKLKKEELRWKGDQQENLIQVKLIINSPWGPIGEKLRSNKDISKGRQQTVASDGLILVEAMRTPLKRRKFDFRNWLQFSKKNLQEPGGWKMSTIWRNWRKENWKSCRSEAGKWEDWQGYLGRGQMPPQCSDSGIQLAGLTASS